MADVLPFPVPYTGRVLRVVRADASFPPLPPLGAHAIEVRDDLDNVLSYAWVSPIVDHDLVLEHAWNWTDALRPLLSRATPPSVAGGA